MAPPGDLYQWLSSVSMCILILCAPIVNTTPTDVLIVYSLRRACYYIIRLYNLYIITAIAHSVRWFSILFGYHRPSDTCETPCNQQTTNHRDVQTSKLIRMYVCATNLIFNIVTREFISALSHCECNQYCTRVSRYLYFFHLFPI